MIDPKKLIKRIDYYKREYHKQLDKGFSTVKIELGITDIAILTELKELVQAKYFPGGMQSHSGRDCR